MIYPVPQKNNLNGEKIYVKSVAISGNCIDIANNVFCSFGIETDGGFNVEIKVTDSKKTTYIDELSRLTDEKYFITVTKEKVVIEASSEKGVFRGVNTLCKLIENDELKVGELEDYPLFETRGYIEGFYGKTWSNEKRLSVMKLMAKYGMNTFYYAPKDDIYHREKWRELYPETELEALKNLYNFATENYLEFAWNIGPGLTYKYTSEEDFNLLIEKIKSIYNIGVKTFGLLLDDIPWEFQYDEDKERFDGIVDAHIYLINKTYKALKDIDNSINLTVCPTQYSGDEKGYYISKFGQGIPADVKMFWTGAEICSRILTVRESDELFRSTNHKPLFWDNFPVNDCEMFQEMHLGAIIGRDKELYKHCEGIISNVMEYAECSKIPLLTIADFLWNPVSYNPDESLENAHKEILGDNAQCFSYFADHLGVSCLSRYSSAFMSNTLAHAAFLEASGKKDEALAYLGEYIKNMYDCYNMISDTSVPLFDELKKWVRKFGMCCDLLQNIYDAKKSPSKDNLEILEENLEKYNSDGVLLTGFCLREAGEKTIKWLKESL